MMTVVMWCVLGKLFPAKVHAERISNYYSHVDKLNFDAIKFPVSIEDIDLFENLNPGISVNVYEWQEDTEEKLIPLRISKTAPSFRQDESKHVDTLIVTDG